MKSEDRTLLALLSEALFPDAAAPERSASDERLTEPIIREAVAQTVATLLPLQSDERYLYLTANNLRITWEHRQLHELLTSRHIPYTVIKGVASAAYYPDPALRTMGDVDFIVRPTDVRRVAELLESAGFVRDGGENEHHFHFRKDKSVWELHWRPPGFPEGNTRLEELMADVIPKARELDGVMVPSHFHHGLILLLHTAEHMLNTGVGLRHLCDWAVFYSGFSDAAFREMIEKPLKAVGLWRFARLLTLVSMRYLRSPARAWAGEAREELLESIMDDIMRSGDFGAKDSDRINQAKLLTNGTERTVSGNPIHNLAATFADKAALAWPLCGRVKVLLPFGVVYVGVRHAVRVARGDRPAIHVKRMLTGADQRRKVYEEFRLFEQE